MAQTDLASRLSDPELLQSRAYLGGKWSDAASGKTFRVTNPAKGDVLAEVADLSREDIGRGIDAAYEAQKAWAKRTAEDRRDILMKWHDLMVENADDLALILTAEQGKPVAEAKAEVIYGAGFIKWFAEEGRRIYGEIIPSHAPDKRIHVIKQPVGVAAAITPWNFPNAMITRKAGPAFAAGCAMVLKPSELTPFSATAMAVLAQEAGLPSGLFSVITGDAATIGGVMTSSPTVRKITFTGSTRVGAMLYEQSAKTIKKLGLELGGNAPFIVFDDADLDAAVEGAILSKYRNNGQTCVCANRIYVQAGVYDAFAEKLAEKVAGMKVGNGAEEGVVFGPLINEAALEKVTNHIADATAKGADIKLGGKPHEKGGTFFQPTILTGVTSDMAVATEETFGPVAPLFKFTEEQEAVDAANATEFGLASYFYSRDIGRAWRVSEALDYGMVGVNTGHVSTAEAPFGGVKSSGLGREGGYQGLDEFMESKYICMGSID